MSDPPSGERKKELTLGDREIRNKEADVFIKRTWG